MRFSIYFLEISLQITFFHSSFSTDHILPLFSLSISVVSFLIELDLDAENSVKNTEEYREHESYWW